MSKPIQLTEKQSLLFAKAIFFPDSSYAELYAHPSAQLRSFHWTSGWADGKVAVSPLLFLSSQNSVYPDSTSNSRFYARPAFEAIAETIPAKEQRSAHDMLQIMLNTWVAQVPSFRIQQNGDDDCIEELHIHPLPTQPALYTLQQLLKGLNLRMGALPHTSFLQKCTELIPPYQRRQPFNVDDTEILEKLASVHTKFALPDQPTTTLVSILDAYFLNIPRGGSPLHDRAFPVYHALSAPLLEQEKPQSWWTLDQIETHPAIEQWAAIFAYNNTRKFLTDLHPNNPRSVYAHLT